jgi:glucosamine 6-phosphate synthetase-like amidotransferase/phosphosugar isomerase protein
MQEVKALDGRMIAIMNNDCIVWKVFCDDVLTIPEEYPSINRIVTSGLGILRGCDIDRSRNFANSVVVE